MMNIKHISMVSLLILALSCTKESQELTPVNETDSPSFNAGFAATKVTHNDDGNALRLAWVKGDRIGIWTETETAAPAQSNSAYLADKEGTASGFSYESRSERIRWQSETEPQSFYACYPYSKDRGADPHKAKVSIPALQSQTNSNETVHLAQLDFMWAAAENLSKSSDDVPLSFHHAFSVLDLELTTDTRMRLDAVIFRCKSNPDAAVSFENAEIDLATGKFDPSTAESKSSEIRLDCDFATSWPSATHAYMLVNPSLGGETMQILAVIGGKEKLLVEKTVPAEGLPVGKVVNVAVDYEVPADVAIKIKDLSSLSTSNCYLVSESDQYYKFKATVKGNGNVPAALSAVAGTADITPKSVLVLWYNTVQKDNKWVDACPILLSSLVFYRDYVFFDTPKDFIPGNVVIAAFAEEGVTYDNITVDENKCINNATLLWSWNIWAADGYDPEATAVISGGKTFMDRNVGAAISGVGSKGEYEPAYAVGNYYQWGRKDPFPSIADYCNYWPCQYANTLIGTPTYTPIVALRVHGQSAAKNVNNQVWGYRTKEDDSFNIDSSWHTIERNSIGAPSSSNSVFSGYAVEHPYVYILNSKYPDGGYYPWVTTDDQSYRAFWGGADSQKTLFDPCPVGWRVCNKAESQSFMQAVFNSATLASNLVGYDFDGHYLPMTSSRSNMHFRTETVKSCGYPTISYMWTSESVTTHNYGYAYAAAMVAPENYADKGQPNTLKEVKIEDSKYLASSCPVRCVKE